MTDFKDLKKVLQEIENEAGTSPLIANELFPWYKKLWYWHIKTKLTAINSEIRSWKFRLKNGFDYRDTWSLDYSCAKWLLPRLKYLRDNNHGYPYQLKSSKQWNKKLDKMIEAFELVTKQWDSEEELNLSSKEYMKLMKEKDKKIKEGLQEFATYYQNLWD